MPSYPLPFSVRLPVSSLEVPKLPVAVVSEGTALSDGTLASGAPACAVAMLSDDSGRSTILWHEAIGTISASAVIIETVFLMNLCIKRALMCLMVYLYTILD
jgi:hypothetical protein